MRWRSVSISLCSSESIWSTSRSSLRTKSQKAYWILLFSWSLTSSLKKTESISACIHCNSSMSSSEYASTFTSRKKPAFMSWKIRRFTSSYHLHNFSTLGPTTASTSLSKISPTKRSKRCSWSNHNLTAKLRRNTQNFSQDLWSISWSTLRRTKKLYGWSGNVLKKPTQCRLTSWTSQNRNASPSFETY